MDGLTLNLINPKPCDGLEPRPRMRGWPVSGHVDPPVGPKRAEMALKFGGFDLGGVGAWDLR